MRPLKLLLWRLADNVSRIQVRLFRHSGSYRRLMLGLSRIIGYALSAEQGFRQIGMPQLDGRRHLRLGGNTRATTSCADPGRPTPCPERIQIFRRGALGDVLLLTPVLRALRQRYPEAKIVVATLYPDILKGNPHVNAIVKAEVPLDGYDVTLEMDYEYTPDEHIVDAYARIGDVTVHDKTPEVYLQQSELARAAEILAEYGVDICKPICGIQVRSGWSVRDWPMNYFDIVAEQLSSDGVQVVVLGSEKDCDIKFGFDLRGRTTIREAAAIIFKASIILTVDSSLMHIAYAMRRPTVALFGCTNPEKRVADWALPSVLYSDIFCRGCHHRQRPVPAIFAPPCPWETVRCMEGLTPELVLSSVRNLLEQTANPKVSIVIPHYNDFPLLAQCLSSIFRCGAGVVFEVIVVVDGSTDDSLERLREWEPRVRIVHNARNTGFSGACNAGVEMAKGEYIVFLNNDTTVTPDWLGQLMTVMESDSRIGAVGPKLVYPGSELIQHCGTVVNEQGIAEHLYRFLPKQFSAANRFRFFRILTGACLLVRKQSFLGLGGFDRSFRMGGEDTDLCFKLLDAGKLLAYCPESIVYHHEGFSRGRRGQENPDDLYNREILSQRWAKYLTPDIADYCLLAEIESNEGATWPWLHDVPPSIVSKYDKPESRQVGRFPFRCEIGSGMHPQPGYIHLDVMTSAPSLDIQHDILDPLPFHENTVGEILANHVIEHITWRSLPWLASEIYRVLILGGRAYIRTPNLRFIMERYGSGETTPEHPDDEKAVVELYGQITPGLWANMKLFSGQDYPSNFHMLCMDPEDLRSVFLRAGFTDVQLRQFGREFSPGEIQLIATK